MKKENEMIKVKFGMDIYKLSLESVFSYNLSDNLLEVSSKDEFEAEMKKIMNKYPKEVKAKLNSRCTSEHATDVFNHLNVRYS